jgi:hypothetical protein
MADQDGEGVEEGGEGEGGEEGGEGGEEGAAPVDTAPKEPELRYCYAIALLAGEGVKMEELQVSV